MSTKKPSPNSHNYSPTISFTQLGLQGTLDWSTTLGADFSSWNHDINYRSGTVLHIDTQLVKHTARGWSFGATAAWLGQTTDDSGALAERLNGFREVLSPLVPSPGSKRRFLIALFPSHSVGCASSM